MNIQFNYRAIKKPVFIGLFVFAILLVLTQYLSYQRYLLLREVEQRELSNEATHTKEGLQNVVSYSFSATQTLAFIVENYGLPSNFDSVANQLLKVNQYIDLIELVQGGVITHVYPLAGNEAVIGFNILQDSARKSGALTTIKKRDFFIAGPIHLKQGGVGFVSRVPIFKNNQFQGFSAAVIKLRTLLHAAGIDTTNNQRFTFQLSKVNAETREEEFFLPVRKTFGESLQVSVEIPNGEWRLYVTDEKNITFSSVIIYVLLGFLLSVTGGFFAWYIAIQPSRLKKLVLKKTYLLKNSELKYKNTLERITDGFAALDNYGRCTYMNQMAGELLKLDPEKMIGIDLLKEFPEGMRPTFYTAYSQAKSEEKHIYSEAYVPLQDRWFETDIYPAQDGTSLFFRDITQKKKAEAELLHVNNRFEMISRTTNDAVWERDFETGQLWSNETHQQFYGLTISDPVPTHEMWAERIHPDDRQAILQKQAVTLASNENIFISEYRFLTEEKGYRNLFDRCYIIRNKEGKATGLMGSIMDMTERKTAEEALRVSEEKYRQIVETAQEGIWMIDAANYTSFVNERMAAMIGYTKEEMEGRPLFEFMDEEGRKISEKNIERRKLGIAEEHEFKLKTKDGRDIWTIMNTNSMLKDGEYLGALAMVTDNTEHKQAESQILKEKELSDSIINSLPGIFYLFDSNKRFLRWNKNFETVSGYTADEIAHIKPIDFYENEGRTLVKEHFAKTMMTGVSAFEANFVTKTGVKIPYYFTGKLVHYEEESCLIGTGIDISERKQSELERQKALDRYHILAKATSDTIWDWDMKSHMMSYNEGVTTMLGYDKAHAETTPDWWKLNLHPDDRSPITETLYEVFLKNKQTLQLSYRFRCADGSYKYIFDRAFVLYDDGGEPIRIIGAMQDVTYEKEEEIRISKAIVNAQEAERQQLGMELHDNVN